MLSIKEARTTGLEGCARSNGSGFYCVGLATDAPEGRSYTLTHDSSKPLL
jgi:hypothetical protein